MNKKIALFTVALLVPALMQGFWNCFKFTTNISNPFVHENAASFRTYGCLNNEDNQVNLAKLEAFDAAYKPWLFTASRASFAVSGASAVVAGTAKYCPQLHNDKVVYAAAATSVLSLVSGMIFNSLTYKNFDNAVKHASSVKVLPQFEDRTPAVREQL